VLDMVLLTKVPGMTIFAPSSYQELQTMLVDALAVDGPCAIRWPKTNARSVPEHEVGHGLRGRCVRRGRDVCLLAVGKMLETAEAAAAALEAEGCSATVWDVRVVKPLDPDMIADAAAHPLVVTIEDGLREGGAGDAMRDAIDAIAPGTDVHVLGTPVAYIPHGKPDQILAAFGLDAVGIATAVRNARAGSLGPRP
jgi:1-deoxy-D-xylulose-5-phosphate synthase